MSLLRKIKSVVRRAVISLILPDEGDHQIMQVSYHGKTSTAEAIYPFGMGGNAPKDAQVFLFNIGGLEENKAGIATLPKERFKLGDKVETWFGHPITGSVVFFRENGDIEAIGKNDLSIDIDRDMDVDIGGDKTENIAGDSIDVIAGDKELSAVNVTIAGSTTTDVISATVNLADLVGRLLMTSDIIPKHNAHVHLQSGGVNSTFPPSAPNTYSSSDATSKTKAS